MSPCATCGMEIGICPGCGGNTCSDRCPERNDDGCNCGGHLLKELEDEVI